ncbi:hypothetical protein E2C01_000089 [Portunus trituberculatus]|uniref:Uncharacterized protein n=1 Tax=Portunus trituberculatus TaxID=210409 RepID=A0A5B7CDP8_PORTR|nr:hypothetical protein [Portunus trituberculatus]
MIEVSANGRVLPPEAGWRGKLCGEGRGAGRAATGFGRPLESRANWALLEGRRHAETSSGAALGWLPRGAWSRTTSVLELLSTPHRRARTQHAAALPSRYDVCLAAPCRAHNAPSRLNYMNY